MICRLAIVRVINYVLGPCWILTAIGFPFIGFAAGLLGYYLLRVRHG